MATPLILVACLGVLHKAWYWPTVEVLRELLETASPVKVALAEATYSEVRVLNRRGTRGKTGARNDFDPDLLARSVPLVADSPSFCSVPVAPLSTSPTSAPR